MIILYYLLGYYVIGLVIMGALSIRQWRLTRNFVSPQTTREFLVNWLASAGLWPLIVFFTFQQGLPKFEDTEDNPQGRLRKRQYDSRRDFARKIPPCGGVIRMVAADYPDNTESVGVFYFESADAWQEMYERVNACPTLQNDDEGHLLLWLSKRKRAHSTPTDVPMGFPRFTVCADKLIRQGLSRAECLICKQVYPVQRLIYRDDASGQKAQFHETLCPKGHTLLRELRMRFF
ncbi:hypothetical protein [Prosthecobacter dejongeii]|uniref:Uncharacterized protein n=1 Tax=Prosthecobacter dejongeii TaxID=48465 RepID=A0A7W7YKQ9_9BACT|nr:hypothetical protein [Prosthecobacter dejongeii]MBB5038021.1 hypothetical protein [Prosthecobacter dejongeii]